MNKGRNKHSYLLASFNSANIEFEFFKNGEVTEGFERNNHIGCNDDYGHKLQFAHRV